MVKLYRTFSEFLRIFCVWSGANVDQSCRSQQILEHSSLIFFARSVVFHLSSWLRGRLQPKKELMESDLLALKEVTISFRRLPFLVFSVRSSLAGVGRRVPARRSAKKK